MTHAKNPPRPAADPSASQRSERIRLRRAIGLVGMTLLLPGSAQLAAGNRKVGRWALRIWGLVLGVVLALALLFLVSRGAAIGIIANAHVLRVLTWVIVALGLGWAVLFLDAMRLARPVTMQRGHGVAVAGTAMALAVALGVGACGMGSAVDAQADMLGHVLAGGGKTEKQAGRYNILLLGADAGKGRTGLRPDSITVASVDAETGRSVLFTLPRNLENVPFPESSPLHKLYPTGYDCKSHECMLNAVYTLGQQHKNLYHGVKDPGLQATKEAVEATLGLTINYYAMVDLKGFEALVDAVGGITLDVNRKVPIGGGTSPIYGYIGPGKNLHLDGFHALWFARSREGSSDWERMTRQKCVMNAMLNQLDPLTVLTKFNAISKAGGQIVRTDVPASQANVMITLAQKAKSKKISSVAFAPPLIYSGDPDFAKIRRVVAETIAAAEAADAPKTAAPASPSATSSATRAKKKDARNTDDLDSVCHAG